MSTIERYVTVSPDNQEGDYEFNTLLDARAAAPEGHAIIERTYTYDDSALVDTPCGCDMWPCRKHCKDGQYRG